MPILAPRYYTNFCCIADRCTHSCCIGWEIDIDCITMQKYDALKNNIGEVIRESIDRKNVAHFRLGDGERCPHLDRRGLCTIISELGDGYLCDICREHPRFYNETSLGLEVGLGLACEEACRIVLRSDDYKDMITIDEKSGAPSESDFDTIPHRSKIYCILSDDSLHYGERTKHICKLYDVHLTTITDKQWREILEELEYLDEAHKELFGCFSADVVAKKNDEKVLERAFAYFIYRHVSAAEDEEQLRAALGFCLFCERLLASVISGHDIDVTEAARIISEELEYSEDNTERIMSEFYF